MSRNTSIVSQNSKSESIEEQIVLTARRLQVPPAYIPLPLWVASPLRLRFLPYVESSCEVWELT